MRAKRSHTRTAEGLLALGLLLGASSVEAQAARGAAALGSGSPQSQRTPDSHPLAVSSAQLSELAGQLGLASTARREAALGELLALGEQDLTSIRQRLHALAADKADRKPWLAKLAILKRTRAAEVKATREDQLVGLRAALEQDQSPAMLRVVELFALLRALEEQRSIAAADVIVNELFALEPRLFRAEFTRNRQRLGKLLVPAYLRARAQAAPALQRSARDGLSALGLDGDASLFAQRDAELLAATIAVESELGHGSALPWFVGLLDDARPAVRDAARHATEAHASEGLDLLRQRMADQIGEEPDPSWDGPHVLTRLLQQLDAARDQQTVQALQRAQPGLRGANVAQLSAVEQHLSEALQHGTSSATAPLAAATYLELATRYDEQNEAARALVANRRALRLAPNGSADAARARARVLYLEAEQRAGRGIADLQTLQTAAELEPGRSAAASLLEELRGLRIDREHELRKRLGFAAALLLTLAALLLLVIRAQARRARRLPDAFSARTTKSPYP